MKSISQRLEDVEHAVGAVTQRQAPAGLATFDHERHRTLFNAFLRERALKTHGLTEDSPEEQIRRALAATWKEWASHHGFAGLRNAKGTVTT